jgi:hypothetical protein
MAHHRIRRHCGAAGWRQGLALDNARCVGPVAPASRAPYMAGTMLRRLIAFIALFALGSVHAHAQTAARGFPSLAKRPVESRDRTVPPTATVEPAPADPALAAQVAQLVDEADAGENAFRRQIAESRGTVTAAAGLGPSSEAWVTAQMAVSALDSARYESVAALAGLDSLYVLRQDHADGARIAADLATITPARSRALALVDAQNDALDALRMSLPQP